MKKLPQARHTDIITQSAGKEILIYNLITHRAYYLNETLSAVYQACDGKISFSELRAQTGFTDEIIYMALDELRRENLLEETAEYNSPFAGMSRREAIRKVGLASMIALPVISSLAAPTALMAQSACTTQIPQAQGNCPAGQRCVDGSCSPCIPNGQLLPGGCSVNTASRCCSSNCNAGATICGIPA